MAKLKWKTSSIFYVEPKEQKLSSNDKYHYESLLSNSDIYEEFFKNQTSSNSRKLSKITNQPENGVQCENCFFKLKHFDMITSLPPDIMHDFLGKFLLYKN